ncbi:hypothetical protein [Weissella viridescens]|uniref:hypothetical protein n=1 Tax=Weissella viridescens TaxID=1629 RepID=UPI003AF2C7AD
MTKIELGDAFLLGFIGGMIATTLFAILICGVLSYQGNEQQYQINMQQDKQQLKIDEQQREISRLKQTNKALANQAKGE